MEKTLSPGWNFWINKESIQVLNLLKFKIISLTEIITFLFISNAKKTLLHSLINLFLEKSCGKFHSQLKIFTHKSQEFVSHVTLYSAVIVKRIICYGHILSICQDTVYQTVPFFKQRPSSLILHICWNRSIFFICVTDLS